MRGVVFAGVLVAAGLAMTSTGAAQTELPPARLFEAGQYDEALSAIENLSERAPADDYLAAQILIKMGRPQDVAPVLSRMRERQGEAWEPIGRSAQALINNDLDGALETASQAAAQAPDNFFAQYQLGLVRAQREDWPAAAEAFERASQIDPFFAYAHYYAGLSYSRARRVDRAAEHFETFLKLAPKAPERLGVESLMRTLRGR